MVTKNGYHKTVASWPRWHKVVVSHHSPCLHAENPETDCVAKWISSFHLLFSVLIRSWGILRGYMLEGWTCLGNTASLSKTVSIPLLQALRRHHRKLNTKLTFVQDIRLRNLCTIERWHERPKWCNGGQWFQADPARVTRPSMGAKSH